MNREKKLIRRGQSFYKLWGAFLITTLVCTIIITFQYLHLLSEKEKQLKESYDRLAMNVGGNLDSLIEWFEEYGRVMVENDGMEDYQTVISGKEYSSEDPTAYRLWNKFCVYFNSTVQGGRNIAFLYLRNSGYIFESTAFEAATNSIKKANEHLGLSEDCWDYMLAADENIRTRLEKTEDMNFGRLVMAKEIYPGVVLAFCVSEDAIWRVISSSYLPEGTKVCLVTENNFAECFQTAGDHDLEDAVYTQISFQDAGKESTKKVRGYYEYCIPIAGKTMKMIVQIPNNWRLVRFHILFRSVLTALAIWIFCGGAFSYLLSVMLYRPVEELMSKIPVDSSLSRKSQEFQLVHRTLKILSKKNKVYEEALERQNHHLADNLWPRLLKGEISFSPEILTILQKEGFPEGASAYIMLRILIMPGLEEDIQEEEKEISLQSISDFLRRYYQKEKHSSYFSESGESITGFLETEREAPDQIYARMVKMKQDLQKQYPIQAAIAVSDLCEDFADIPGLYQRTEDLTEYMILMDDYDSVYMDGYNVESLHMPLFEDNRSLKDIQKLSNCIQYKQFQEAAVLLDSIFEQFTIPAPEHIVESAREITYLLDTITISLDSREFGEEIDRLTIERQMLRRQNLQSTRKYLKELFEELQEKKSRETSNRDKIMQICAYIEDHYADSSLSAQAVADVFGVRISWLSATFKQERKENFLDYVHKCRIAKIQELMASTDLSLKDISSRVGYVSYVTMTRAFKRYTGVAPKWYRENLTKE